MEDAGAKTTWRQSGLTQSHPGLGVDSLLTCVRAL